MASQNNTEPEEYGFDAYFKMQNKAALWVLGFLPIFIILSVTQYLILRNIDPEPLYRDFPFYEPMACTGFTGVERLYGDTRVFLRQP